MEDGSDLKAPGKTEAVDPMWRQRVDTLAIEADFPGSNRKSAANEVEARGLTGAIRTDHAVTLPCGDVQGDAADDFGRAEVLPHVSQGQRGHRRISALRFSQTR